QTQVNRMLNFSPELSSTPPSMSQSPPSSLKDNEFTPSIPSSPNMVNQTSPSKNDDKTVIEETPLTNQRESKSAINKKIDSSIDTIDLTKSLYDEPKREEKENDLNDTIDLTQGSEEEEEKEIKEKKENEESKCISLTQYDYNFISMTHDFDTQEEYMEGNNEETKEDEIVLISETSNEEKKKTEEVNEEGNIFKSFNILEQIRILNENYIKKCEDAVKNFKYQVYELYKKLQAEVIIISTKKINFL